MNNIKFSRTEYVPNIYFNEMQHDMIIYPKLMMSQTKSKVLGVS